MMGPSTAREALIVEAIGEVARLIQEVQALAPVLNETCQRLRRTDAHLLNTLADFETRMAAASQTAQTQAVQRLQAHMNESAKRTIASLSQTLVEGARMVFNAEIGRNLRALQELMQTLAHRPNKHWEQWLKHAATAALASTLTGIGLVWPW